MPPASGSVSLTLEARTDCEEARAAAAESAVRIGVGFMVGRWMCWIGRTKAPGSPSPAEAVVTRGNSEGRFVDHQRSIGDGARACDCRPRADEIGRRFEQP